MPEISIIIRTKNEERWIAHCLAAIFQQDYDDFEVILVDNASLDHTVHVAQRFPLASIIKIDKFLPGKALNDGIRASKGQFIVCLSAHCIPKNKSWLSTLLKNFKSGDMLAGVYGRQLPLSFTEDIDKRDLLTVFGQDRRVQIKDYFFHNANSMLRREVWEKFPFDEHVTNIEDRVWGKLVVDAGYHIIYDPDASVYHHHGLHQGNEPKRAKGVISIIEQIDNETANDLPDSMKPEFINIVAVIPVQEKLTTDAEAYQLLKNSVDQLKKSIYIKQIYLLTDNNNLAKKLDVQCIDRNTFYDNYSLGIDELLQKSLAFIESFNDFPEAILYVNYEYLNRPINLFDEIIYDAQYKGYDTVFPGYMDYGHYWIENENNEFYQTDSSMKNRKDRMPVYKALYGLGCLTSAAVIRSGKLIGGKIGILPITLLKNTFRLKDVS
jgi:rhamnosyltransferase